SEFDRLGLQRLQQGPVADDVEGDRGSWMPRAQSCQGREREAVALLLDQAPDRDQAHWLARPWLQAAFLEFVAVAIDADMVNRDARRVAAQFQQPARPHLAHRQEQLA